MIAELFYPKELKDIIADLRAKDDLNEEALNNIRFIPIKIFFFWFMLVIFIWQTIKSPEYLILSLVFSGIFTFFLIIYCLYTAIKMSLVYKNGILQSGTLISLNFGGRSRKVLIKIKDDPSGKIISMGTFLPSQVKADFPKLGERLSYFSLGNNRVMNMPNYFPIKKKYCLSLSMLKD